MEENLLLSTLYRKRIEIKYVLITLVLVGSLLLLEANHVFAGLEQRVNAAMSDLAEYGALGTFLIALSSNTTLVIQVPYNLPMFTVLLYADTFWKVVLIGAATGLGGGIGEVWSYAVARFIITRVDDMENSALFRWTRHHIERHPAWIPYLILLASGVPVPDLLIIVPVAMVNYPWRKVIVPMLIGKIFQNVVVAFIFRYAADQVSIMTSGNLNIDVTAILVVLFGIIIAYQIEDARLAQREANSAGRDTPVTLNPVSASGEVDVISPFSVVHVFEKATDKPVEP
jgi:membrane protein YqaA with SNARE-associated domain